MKTQQRVTSNSELASTEELLGAEVDRLQQYNRLLERGLPAWLTAVVAGFRDEQIKRIESLQVHIRSCRSSMEDEP